MEKLNQLFKECKERMRATWQREGVRMATALVIGHSFAKLEDAQSAMEALTALMEALALL